MQKDLSIFEEVNEILTCEDVAKNYGLNVRNHKTHCIFHDEKTPSLSFKNNFFHCFGCGASGGTVNFAMKLLEIDNPLEIVKKLDEDFHLKLNYEKKKDNVRYEQKNYNLEIIKQFDNWWSEAFNNIINYYDFCENIIYTLKPKTESEFDSVSDVYIEAINKIDYYDYLLDCMIKCGNNYEEKIRFYNFYIKENL